MSVSNFSSTQRIHKTMREPASAAMKQPSTDKYRRVKAHQAGSRAALPGLLAGLASGYVGVGNTNPDSYEKLGKKDLLTIGASALAGAAVFYGMGALRGDLAASAKIEKEKMKEEVKADKNPSSAVTINIKDNNGAIMGDDMKEPATIFA